MTWFQTLWAWIQKFVQQKFWYIVVAGASGLVVAAFIAAYGSVIDYTSSLNFCAHSCHEMESTVYAEYIHSKHFKNEHGVVVVCADCHVPHHDWPATLITKMGAALELWPHFFGGMSNTATFQRHRAELAKNVWAHFAATNARECKACHKFANMVLTDQNPAARALHTQAMKVNENCLDCHKGIVHSIAFDSAQTATAGDAVASAQTSLKTGQEVYSKACAACHDNMSPKLGDKAAWAPLLKQGEAELVSAAIHGKGMMPARGGNASLSDGDVKAAVEYIQSKAQ